MKTEDVFRKISSVEAELSQVEHLRSVHWQTMTNKILELEKELRKIDPFNYRFTNQY